jgi:hypothetical protein
MATFPIRFDETCVESELRDGVIVLNKNMNVLSMFTPRNSEPLTGPLGDFTLLVRKHTYNGVIHILEFDADDEDDDDDDDDDEVEDEVEVVQDEDEDTS